MPCHCLPLEYRGLENENGSQKALSSGITDGLHTLEILRCI